MSGNYRDMKNRTFDEMKVAKTGDRREGNYYVYPQEFDSFIYEEIYNRIEQ